MWYHRLQNVSKSLSALLVRRHCIGCSAAMNNISSILNGLFCSISFYEVVMIRAVTFNIGIKWTYYKLERGFLRLPVKTLRGHVLYLTSIVTSGMLLHKTEYTWSCKDFLWSVVANSNMSQFHVKLGIYWKSKFNSLLDHSFSAGWLFSNTSEILFPLLVWMSFLAGKKRNRVRKITFWMDGEGMSSKMSSEYCNICIACITFSHCSVKLLLFAQFSAVLYDEHFTHGIELID